MAAAILPLIGSIVGVVLNQLWNPIKQQLCYCITIHRNVQDLQEATKALQDQRDDVKDEIAGAERNFAAPTRRVQGWLGLVDEAESKAAAIVKQYEERRQRCSLNCWSGCPISRRAQKQIKRVRELRDGGAFDAVTTEVPPDQSFREVPAAAARGVWGLEASLVQALAFVRNDSGDGMLGIWGMGGVGKTTLLKQIHSSCIGDPAFGFDHVVFIVASRECTVAKVQKDVASNLGLPIRDGERAQAAVIFNFLKNKSFLLLLDDLWRRLDLESVGVPQPLGTAGECRHKMILTTRNEAVCGNMEAREKIKVECLKEEDAWRLFEAKAGEDVTNSHPRIRDLAKEVVAECGGLPLALITVGRAMSAKRSPEEWENAVDLLKMSWLPDIPGAEKDTFSLLKFSYDNLESETMRRCFLCCSLWPEDCNISKDELIRCWMGCGLIDEFSDIDGAYRMGYSIVGGLQEACMLEPGDDDQTLVNMHVKMHDLIRDMALWIASDCGENKSNWLVRAGVGLQEAPADEERWLAAQRVSLMNNNLQAFQPSDIACPNLTVLMLQNNHNLPIRIFETVANFHELTYLDLQATYIRSFPVEICRLVKLQYLNLSSTGIAELPVELGNLVNLKYLFLRGNLTLKTLPQNLMLQLRRLRVLDLFLSDIDHRENIPYLATLVTDLEGTNAHLKALGICVQTVSDIRRIAALPGTRTKSLCLHKLEGVTSLDILSAHSLEYRNIQMSLKELVIAGCGCLAEVVAEGGPRDQDRHLPRLEFLRFKYLSSLQRILWRRAGLYLREVTISHCHTLEHVTWVRDLPCLEYLDVRQCRRMKRVVGSDRGEIVVEEAEAEAEAASAPMLPRLKKLMLWGLPELESVCDRTTFFPELRIINVVWCPKVRKITIMPRKTQSKMRLYCEAEWWENLDWGDDGAKTYFIPLFIEDD